MQRSTEAAVPATISLTDCLACSGCITSAETILVTQQSDTELYQVLQENADATAVRSWICDVIVKLIQ